MLVNLNASNKVTGFVSISNAEKEQEFLNANPSYIKTDFVFTEQKDLYEYNGTTFTLVADWETIKAEREAEANNATLNASGVQVPKSVTARQARLALLGAGLLDQVESSLNALPPEEGQPALITWQYSNEIERANPLLETLGLALGLTDEQIDDLFISASQL